ncbi:rCG52968, partial [Rattus norvegicus]
MNVLTLLARLHSGSLLSPFPLAHLLQTESQIWGFPLINCSWD